MGPMNNPVQTNLELHKFFGFYTLLLMLMVTFSGVYISRPDWFQKMKPRSQEQQGQKIQTVNFNFAELSRVVLPKELPISIRPDRKTASFHITNGKGLEQRLHAETFALLEPAATKPKDMRAIQDELHSGHFWSWLGEILVFISGLLPAFFYVSGFYVWFKKSQSRRKLAERKA